jgi:hypothetical protein
MAALAIVNQQGMCRGVLRSGGIHRLRWHARCTADSRIRRNGEVHN